MFIEDGQCASMWDLTVVPKLKVKKSISKKTSEACLQKCNDYTASNVDRTCIGY